MLDILSIPFELKDIDTKTRRVVKYVSAFGNIDSHKDIMQKGAYAKTIKESRHRIKMLWNHNAQDLPVGVMEAIEEDDFGLKVTSKLMATTKGNDLLICYENGAITEHSVGFFTINKKTNDAGVRIITEAQLIEYSAVLWGSNENTPVVGMKSTNPVEQYEELNKRHQRLYKSLYSGNLTDETCELLAIEVAIINKSMLEIIKSLTPAEPEIISTPELVVEPTEVKITPDLLGAFLKGYKK